MADLNTVETPSSTTKSKNRKVSTWPDAFVRIAGLAALTGNFLPLIVLAVIALIIWRLSSGDLKLILTDLINARWFAILGWVNFLGAVFVSIRLFKWKDRIH